MQHFLTLDFAGMIFFLSGTTGGLLLMRLRRVVGGMAVMMIGVSIQSGIQFVENWVTHGLDDLRTDSSGVVLVVGILAVFLILRTANWDRPKRDIPQDE